MPSFAAVGFNKLRKGIFYDHLKRIKNIYALQTKISSFINNWIREEKGSELLKKVHPEIINLMK